MTYDELKKTGVTTNTPKHILLGAGTIHKGLTFSNGAWNFSDSLIGATSGGSKFTETHEYKDIEADGMLVKTKGMTVKVGETAQLETNFLEITPDVMKLMAHADANASTDFTGYTEIKPHADIEAGDWVSNLAFVGKTADGLPIIILLENALCTSGLTLEGKNKDNNVSPATFECYATLDDNGNLDKLPWRIIYPTVNG